MKSTLVCIRAHHLRNQAITMLVPPPSWIRVCSRFASGASDGWTGGGVMARLMRSVVLLIVAAVVSTSCATSEWPRLWSAYQSTFLDGQIRVIDRDSGDRTTSEGQAYAMFFALVDNDRTLFDKLLRWTDKNLAAGGVTAQLPGWLWGRGPDDRWTVIDDRPRSNADVWLAYTL